ncbi:phosphohistidine phosphatase SixA [Alkalibacterium subtropicum]|uniref:Phosphohistidine phosphatase SixA n=1 Tax=Alkalibacterium subtropicum TaxID=753702 RepID=A0A1I1JEC9_9LACT|nr:CHAD domain-containing protein [Alkalibacterium subtropicum]SFC44323.1 phosphohistidine phosphatase SixA [Alkalibacterium subtropicum]
MSIELLMVRHGKAEDRSADKDDAKRQLTEEGKAEFRDFIASVKKDLETDQNVKVWTSPLARAKQTAAILTEQMDWPEADEKEFLESGDYTAFRNEVQTLDADTRLVCVGHKPIQGDWVGLLTSRPYSFKKGGAALVRLNDDRTQGKLLWDNDPTSKKKADEKVAPIKAVLLKQVEAMEMSYRHFQNNPYSPKQTHRFRVNMRKMRSLLHFVKPLIGKETYRTLNDTIKDAYHRLEPLREGDVLIASCSERAAVEPDLIDDYAEVFRYLHNERRKWMRTRLTQSMTAAFEEMLQESREEINRLSFDLDKTDDGDVLAYLNDRFNSRKKKVYKAFKKADHSDHEAAHDVRKKAKKLRYAVKGFEALLPKKKAKKAKKKLKAIQNELGEIGDLYVNSLWLKDYAEKVEDPKLEAAFTALAERQLSQREEVIDDEPFLHDA